MGLFVVVVRLCDRMSFPPGAKALDRETQVYIWMYWTWMRKIWETSLVLLCGRGEESSTFMVARELFNVR